MAEIKTNILTIDDGMEAVPINNKLGRQIGVFYFRPTDMNMYKRYQEVIGSIADIVKPLESVDIETDGTSNEVETVDKVQEALYEKCDYLFGGNFSEAFFGDMHPFSPVGGRFYCEVALEAVGNYIAERMKEQTKESEKRIKKYTQKWDK